MKQTLYVLVGDRERAIANSSFQYLQVAAKQRGVAFQVLTIPETAYAYADVPKLGEGGIYRITANNKRLSQYFHALLLKNPQLKHWFVVDTSRTSIGSSVAWQSVMRGTKEGLQVIPTLFGLSGSVDEALLKRINTHLGGFPVIIKMTGGSHGSGVLLVESARSFKAIVNHTIAPNDNRYVLRKYIPNARNYRIVVLDGKAICATEYPLPKDDFRSNATNTPVVLQADPDQKVLDLAIASAHNAGVVYGGADILADVQGNAYLAEINTPCNFARSQKYTGIDIAGQLVEYLTSHA